MKNTKERESAIIIWPETEVVKGDRLKKFKKTINIKIK
jgi:hypothetical protein